MAERNITHAKTDWLRSIIIGLVLIIIGILLAVYQRDALKIILMGAGIVALIVGGAYIYEYLTVPGTVSLPYGAILIALGIVFIVVPGFVSDVLMALLAVILIVFGALAFVRFAVSDEKTTVPAVINMVIGMLMMILGVYAVFNLEDTADIVMIVIGVFIVIAGAIEVLKAYEQYKWIH